MVSPAPSTRSNDGARVLPVEPPSMVMRAPAALDDTPKKRLTYLMLFRIGVVTLLLGATLVAELATPTSEPSSPQANILFGLIALTYFLNLVFAVALQRLHDRAALARLAIAQVASDLVLTTVLVHFSGGVESAFGFMYLIIIVGASFVLSRGALFTAIAAIVAYATMLALRRWVPLVDPATLQPLRYVLRTATVNSIAFAATGVLAARLAVELRRAGERIESQGARLRDLAALHKDVIRCLTSGLVTIDREGRIITYNNAAAEILGIEAGRAVGRSVDAVMPSLRTLLDSVPENAPVRRSEASQRTPNGERTLGLSLSPLVDSEGRVLGRIISFQDLTELRRMEEAMHRSERLAAIGRLAAGVAHEIRNPLAAISGSIELLAQSPGSDGDSAELMSIVTREVTRLNALITELLAFARPRSPEPQPLDLAATLKELLTVFEHERRQDGVRVELTATEAVWIDADAAQLRQVVWNLVRNACEASPPDSTVEVTVDAVDDEGRGWARLAVADHGAGISLEHQARIFEPFFSTKKGGTGLGLATVHRIVEEHKGRIRIHSRAGGGTRFEVLLPRRESAAT